MTPAVVVDVGNSRVKLGLCSAAAVTEAVALPPDEPGAWLRQVEEKLRAVSPKGGTQPKKPLLAALRMKPQPDLVYFLTDGEIAPEDLNLKTIADANQGRTRIHVIDLVVANPPQPESRLIYQLAKQNRGTYTPIIVTP